MKKLLCLAVALVGLFACNRDDMNAPDVAADKTQVVPHIYGWMALDDAGPQTRGVAISSKLWSKPIAEKNLTVKFLNGTDRYKEFVEEAAQEWTKYANVNFQFVPDDQDALIRVGFDYVKGMSSSWALTGTDHLQKYGNQDEATVHFAQWRRASDEAKRSDVLRAFGQVLGLELEFRHPSFTPGWITDTDGNIDEATIREYWENELNEIISWEELKKVVLDPLNIPDFLIEKTEKYDPESVMTWPFYEMIAQNIPVVEFDEDYKIELSEQDKKFIKDLYGGPSNTPEPQSIPLIAFNYTGTKAKISLTTTKPLLVAWNTSNGEISNDQVTYIKIPSDQWPPYTATVEYEYEENKTYEIIIGEVLEYGQEIPSESSALEAFDLLSGEGMENLNLQPKIPNKALSYVRVMGGKDFKVQQLNFADNNYLKELYLTCIGDSKVTIDNCPNLEIFATSPSICDLDFDALGVNSSATNAGINALSDEEQPIENLIIRRPLIKIPVPGPYIPELDPIEWQRAVLPWPVDPPQTHSLRDNFGTISVLTIQNCPKLKKLSLEHTCIHTFSFSNLSNLEYLYLSSTPEDIVGIGASDGDNLKAALSTLPNRIRKSAGKIIIRGIKLNRKYKNPYYEYTPVTYDPYYIDLSVTRKNWAICWDPQITLSSIQ